MRLRHFAGSLLVFAVVATDGCHKTQPLGALPSPTHEPCDAKVAWDTVLAHDDLGWPSMRVAVQVPQFGGAYIDTVLKVYVTDLSARDRIRQAIDQYNLYGRRGREVRFLQGTYSYRDLRGWGQCILPFWPREGVASYGISERDNRVMFTVVNDEVRKHLELVISRLHLPRGAFIIEHGDYARVVQRLRVPVENLPLHSTL